jgi:hypothetical protein
MSESNSKQLPSNSNLLVYLPYLYFLPSGCGAINLKTGTKRKAKQGSGGGGPSPKVLVIDTSSNNRPDTATTPLVRVLSPSGLENGSSNDSKKRKKARTTFTGKQIYELERQFEIKKYLSSSERSEMARLLNVTEVQVRPFTHSQKRTRERTFHSDCDMSTAI